MIEAAGFILILRKDAYRFSNTMDTNIIFADNTTMARLMRVLILCRLNVGKYTNRMAIYKGRNGYTLIIAINGSGLYVQVPFRWIFWRHANWMVCNAWRQALLRTEKCSFSVDLWFNGSWTKARIDGVVYEFDQKALQEKPKLNIVPVSVPATDSARWLMMQRRAVIVGIVLLRQLLIIALIVFYKPKMYHHFR